MVRTSMDEAEIAVAVIDSWHRRGVGRTLLTAVRTAAEAQGLDRAHGTRPTGNHAVQACVHSVVPHYTTHWDDGVLRLTCHLNDNPNIHTLDLVAGASQISV